MLHHSILAFTTIAVVVVLMPGADTVLVLDSSLRYGSRAGIVTATGVVCGPVLWGALAGLGVAVILSQNPLLSSGIAVAGGLYLCYLAFRSFSAAHTSWRSPSTTTEATPDVLVRRTPLTHFLTGLTTNVLNPKIGIFYLSVMPTLFIGRQISLWLGALLGLIHATLGIAFLTGVSVLSGVARRRLSHPRSRAPIELACAICLLGFGVYAVMQASSHVLGAHPPGEQRLVVGLDHCQPQCGAHLDPQPSDARRR